MRLYKITPVFLMLTLLVAVPASAHVSVKPAEVGVASYTTFSVGVPNEKDGNPTVAVRLVMPEGLKYVQPNVKTGWTITTKLSGSGEDTSVSEISWTGGQIPAGQRDEFLFAAQAPAKTATLNWKAYQTYADGTTVAWDQAPTGDHADGATPYSQTKVIDDTAATQAGTHDMAATHDSSGQTALLLSVLALVAGVAALIRTLRKPAAK